jgi:VWFA-related protein
VNWQDRNVTLIIEEDIVMKIVRLVLSILLLCITGFPTPGLRQEPKKSETKPDQADIKLKAELIQFDVVVTDRDNRPVTGLKKEDFQLFDNNKEQEITHFSYEESIARRVDEDTELPNSLPRAITNAEVKRIVAFVVDTMRMKIDGLNGTRKALLDFVDKKMAPGDLILILPTSGGSGLLQQFTSDQRLLRRAIDRLRVFSASVDTTTYLSLDRMMAGSRVRQQTVGPAISGRTFSVVDPLEQANVRATLTTLNNVIKGMGKLPGRKLAVFISEGMRLQKTDSLWAMTQTTARATRAHVVFHTVDPRGLEPLTLSASDSVGVGSAVAYETNKKLDFAESQDSLLTLALDTGGKFHRNNNDVQELFNRVIEENRGYYLVGFQPRNDKWDGKYHRVKIVVRGRPELNVSTNKGYLAATEKAPVFDDPRIARMVEAISSPLVRRDIDLRLTPFYRDDERGDPNLISLLHIDTRGLNFRQVEEKHQANFEIISFLFGANGKEVDSFSSRVSLDLRPETYRTVLDRGLVSTRVSKVKPGVYQVRVLVQEADTGLIGTANDFIEVPNLKGDRMTLSSIFLDARYDEKGQPAADVGQNETLAQRRYRAGGQFTYVFVVYNAGSDKSKQPQLEVQSSILKGGSVVFEGDPRPLQVAEGSSPPQRIVSGGVMQLGELAPGDYTFRVTVRDKLQKDGKRSKVQQMLDFSIE